MSKRFKSWEGQACTYCPGDAETNDHVLARSFFPPPERRVLPSVPACRRCNGEKGKLETYLSAVLLFGGRHADARANLDSMGGRRLAGNAALRKNLQRGAKRLWLEGASGLSLPTMTLPINPTQFTRYFEYVIRGLFRFEFGDAFGIDDRVEVHTITSVAGEPLFRKLLALKAAARTQRNLGRGAFIYEGAQGTDNSRISVWLVSAFGGLMFRDKEGAIYETRIGALTGPRSVGDRMALREKWLKGRGAFAT